MSADGRARDLGVGLLWASGLSRIAGRLLGRGRFVLELHGIASRRYPDLPATQSGMAARDLEALLAWLSPRYRFLDPDRLFDATSPGVLLTFDDGFRNHHDVVLPLLVQYQAPAVFFVATQHMRDPRDWLPSVRAQVAKVWSTVSAVPRSIAADLYDGLSADRLRGCVDSGLVTIGSHSVSHPLLTACDDHRLRYELEESKRSLEEVIDRPVDLFAYPTGDYDARVVDATRAAGYRAAFAEDSRSVGRPRYEVPRIGLYSARPSYLAAKLSGLHRRPLQALRGDAVSGGR